MNASIAMCYRAKPAIPRPPAIRQGLTMAKGTFAVASDAVTGNSMAATVFAAGGGSVGYRQIHDLRRFVEIAVIASSAMRKQKSRQSIGLTAEFLVAGAGFGQNCNGLKRDVHSFGRWDMPGFMMVPAKSVNLQAAAVTQ
jgi:hypothetical protein